MELYFAPLEGINEHIYRNTYNKFFGNIDKYFAPFIVPNMSKSLKTKELIDLLPENNIDINLVPQILTNDSEGFINTAKKLKVLGYKEVNLNLGCPVGTVVSKNKGSGFLAYPEELDEFLDEIYQYKDIKISIKTRIGKEEPEEFYKLIEIYNKYPIEELIIHPRTRKDFYGNKPNLKVFYDALNCSKNRVCYNGDIFSKQKYIEFREKFNNVNKIMIGRGILANPFLINEIVNDCEIEKIYLKEFHDTLLNNYLEVFDKDKFAIYRMKELWGYMIHMFSNKSEYSLKIRKSNDIDEYKKIIDDLFKEEHIVKGSGLFSNK